MTSCSTGLATVVLEHQTPERTYRPRGRSTSARIPPSRRSTTPFAQLRDEPRVCGQERAQLAAEIEREPDKALAFVAEMDMEAPSLGAGERLVYACPMHPEVVSQKSPGSARSVA